MSSPIFDSTFGTGRFKREEPMTTDPTTSASPEPQGVREALADLIFAAEQYLDFDGDRRAIPDLIWRAKEKGKAALAQSDAEPHRDPDDTKVICPNCTHQFRAISVMDQARLAQSDARPQDVREALANATLGHRSDSSQVTMPQMLRNFADAVEAGMLRVSVSANIVADPNTGSQSDAEPVAWQTRRKGSPDWHICIGEPIMDSDSYEARPLYTAPPRPDASGLIEAAEWRIIFQALRIAHEDGSIDNFVTDAEYETLKEKVRSRAADRSMGKGGG